MSVLTSEAVVLRTWPVHEADLIVSIFTRDYGKLRGVAKSALKSRKRFGGALEPMTLTRAWFVERPRQELARLDQLEIIRSPLSAPVDQPRLTVLSFFAEVLEEVLPEHDPQETVFRLLASVLEHTTAAQSETVQPWMPLTYFSLWMTRLTGLLPDIAHCTVCGEALQPAEVYFNSHADGLFCSLHRGGPGSPTTDVGRWGGNGPGSPTTDVGRWGGNGSAGALSADSWQLALRMLRSPASAFAGDPWPRRRAQDLRRFSIQVLERHLERRLRSAESLARLGA